MKILKKWISLIELLITISLLLILWSIWYISFSWYVSSVRDSSRIIELHNIDSVIRWFKLNSWFYPEPTDWINITYSGANVWNQWILWSSVLDTIWYSRNIFDPLTNSKYTYSLVNNWSEFSLAWVLEDEDEYSNNSLLLNHTFAEGVWSIKWFAIIVWNYNWEIIPIVVNNVNNILTLPTIVSNNLSSTDLVDIINSNSLVYTNYSNLPLSYTWTKFDISGNIDFAVNNLVVFSWSISKLSNKLDRINLLKNIVTSYSWSLLEKKISVSSIDKIDLFSVEPSKSIERIACDFVNFKLGNPLECN